MCACWFYCSTPRKKNLPHTEIRRFYRFCPFSFFLAFYFSCIVFTLRFSAQKSKANTIERLVFEKKLWYTDFSFSGIIRNITQLEPI
mgnify:CR=1 FL=1